MSEPVRLYFDQNPAVIFEAGRIIGEHSIPFVMIRVAGPATYVDFATDSDAVKFKMAVAFPTMTTAEFDQAETKRKELQAERNRLEAERNKRSSSTVAFKVWHMDPHAGDRVEAAINKLGLTIVDRYESGDYSKIVLATVEERKRLRDFTKGRI